MNYSKKRNNMISQILQKKVFLWLMMFFMFSGGLYAADINQKITVKFNGITLKEAFVFIEKETGFSIIYSTDVVKDQKKITYTASKIKLSDLLKYLLKDCDCTYQMEDNQLFLVPELKTTPGKQSTNPKLIKGIVKDEKGEPVIGATIIEKGTSNGTITDINGQFSLSVPEKKYLHISSVGYKNSDILVEKDYYDITLFEDVRLIEEVVVIGYGTQKKVNLTGAVEMINKEDIESRPISNITSGLQGMLSGTTITQNNGQPGGGKSSIRIRGMGTISSSSEPYILIDGVEGDMNLLNPDDIESVSVLKDAASAAIYGARAANGVILVTTRKASKETHQTIRYSGYYGLQTPSRLPEMVNGYEYMMLHNEAKRNKGDAELFSEAIMNIYKSGNFDTDDYADTDWIEEVYRDAASQQNHSINISGNSGKMGYYSSYGYLNQEGLVVNNPFNSKRHNIRMRINTSFFKERLKLDAGLSYAGQTTSSSPYEDTGGVFRLANRIDPLVPVKYKNGEWGIGSVNNPVAVAEAGGKKTVNTRDLIANINTSLNIFEGLNANLQFTYDRLGKEAHNFQKGILKFDKFGIPLLGNDQIKSKLIEENYSIESKNIMINLNYERSFNDHNFSTLLGYNEEYNLRKLVTAMRENFPMGDEVEMLDTGTENISNSGTGSHNTLRSFFGRINYDYSGRYLFEVNLRNDASSRFAPDKRWGTFPSFSTGWRFSDETFMKWTNSVMQMGKFRISWGELGNERVGNDGNYFPYLGLIESKPSSASIGGVDRIGFYQRVASNKNLTWETAEIFNMGFDFRFFNNRLNFTGDIFTKNTRDVLLKAEYSAIIGVYRIDDLPEVNMGNIENKGWEITASWKDKIKDFGYNIIANISDVQNKVTSLGSSQPRIDEELRRVGDPLNAYYGYVTDGLMQPSDFETYDPVTGRYSDPKLPVMDAYKTIIQPGDIKYMDLTDDGNIDGDDRKVIGNPNPRYTYSLKADIDWKGIDFSVYFQGVGKVNGYLGYEARHALIDDYSIPKKDHLDRWTPDNQDAKYPRLYYGQGHNREFSDYWVENASYLRIKNLQLGYTFSQEILKKLNLERLRVYVSADNIYTMTEFYKYYDPEIGRTNGSDYPQVKTFVIGLSMSLLGEKK